MNPDNIGVYELRQDVIHNLQALWRACEESPATREGHSWVRGRRERTEPLVLLLGLGCGPQDGRDHARGRSGAGAVGTGAWPGCAGEEGGTSRECVRKLKVGVYDLTAGTFQRLATALGVQ